MRNLLSHPHAVAAMSVAKIEEDARLYESRGGAYSLHLVEANHLNRHRAQHFIQDAYRRAFKAEIREFYPSIITLRDRSGSLRGAVGARSAADQPLFIEQYVDEPIESMVIDHSGRSVERNRVVEIGNLAVARPAFTYPFMQLIGEWLVQYDVQWLVFALTKRLRRLFGRTGVEMHELGPALPDRLQSRNTDWGSYYAHDPRIVAMKLAPALQRFSRVHRLPDSGSVETPGTLRAVSL